MKQFLTSFAKNIIAKKSMLFLMAFLLTSIGYVYSQKHFQFTSNFLVGGGMDKDGDGYCRGLKFSYTIARINSTELIAATVKVVVKINGIQVYSNSKSYAKDEKSSQSVSNWPVMTPGSLPPGSYNVKVELYENGTIIDNTNSFTSKLECADEDRFVALSNFAWKNAVDSDGDGYRRSATLSFSANPVDAGYYSFVINKKTQTGSYTTYATSPSQSFDTAAKTVSMDITGLAYDSYSFQIQTMYNSKVIATIEPTESTVLQNQKFEPNAEDVLFKVNGQFAGVITSGIRVNYKIDDVTKNVSSNASGAYSVPVSYNKTVTITPSSIGYTFTPPNYTVSDVKSDLSGYNFTSSVAQYSISGKVSLSGLGVENVTIDYGLGTTITDANGNFSFNVNHGESIILKPSKNTYVFTPDTIYLSNIITARGNQNFTATIKNDATLSNLTVNQGSLSPAFSSSATNYTVNVANNITSITLVATKNHSAATVTGDGTKTSLVVGNNTFNIVVTAEDGTTTKTYTVTVNRAAAKSTDATLSNLSVNQGSISPAFSSSTTNYTVNAANNITSITLTAAKNHTGATVTGDGTKIGLAVGNNTFNIVVTAEDGTTTKTYTVTVNRAAAKSTDATLSNLTVSQGSLSPAFSSNTTNYTVNVANNITSITLTATKNHVVATVTGDGTKTGLVVGNNTFNIIVTAEDGTTTKTYMVTVNRAAAKSNDATLSSLSVNQGSLSPAFSSSTTNYTVNVANNITSITLTAVKNHTAATVTGDGTKTGLAVGNNTFNIVVMAEDGTTTKTYTVTVNRAAPKSTDATLSNLSVNQGSLSPVFNSTTTNYTVNVANNITSITFTATKNHASATVIGDGTKTGLAVGNNIFNIVVTAEDGTTTKTYTVTVNRAAPKSIDATLSNLTVPQGSLSPVFNSTTTNYTVNVANNITSITLTVIKNHAAATVTGDGTKTGLAVGNNTFNIIVTAEDGTTTKTYTVTVNRDALSGGTIYYVKTTGSDALDGKNWNGAKKTVQDALNVAQAGDVIFVAQGTYTLTASLQMKEGVNVYGGFAGTETDLSQRPVITFGKTTGGQASILDANASSTNIRRVLYQPNDFATTTVWDGFILRNGYFVTNTSGSGYGGGAYLLLNGEINNSMLANNTAICGGGAYLKGANANNTLFSDNQSINNDVGGGLGGGIRCIDAHINNCVVTNNSATMNTSYTGGGYGGGVYCSNSTINNSVIANNSAIRNAGTGNSGSGGGIASSDGSVINNCVISKNFATNKGGAIYQEGGTLCNSIIWGNNTQIYVNSGTPTITYSAIQDGGVSGVGNLKLNTSNTGSTSGIYYPQFILPSTGIGRNGAGWSAANWNIASNSVCIDAGTPDTAGFNLPVADLASNPRISGGRIDIGAYEYQYPKQNQTITWNQNLTANVGDSPITLMATASSGLVISYTSSNTNVATTSGNTLTIVGAGTATITAKQAGSTNYNAATDVTKTLTVNLAKSTDATLSNLTVNQGSLSPAFSSTTTNYTVNVANNITSITLTATKNHAGATVTGDGTKTGLAVGNNTFNIVITAEDGTTTKTYMVTVNRSAAKSTDATLSNLTVNQGSLSPAFSSNTTNYTVNVANNITSITLTATKNHAGATVTGDGTKTGLAVGNNTFNIIVTAEDGTTTKTYTVTVNRAAAKSTDATLSNLTVSQGSLSPAFSASTTNYTVNVANNITSISLTATKNHAAATVTGDGTKTGLAVGNNAFNIIVTAEDGITVKTYTITVNRAAAKSTDATLSNLTVSQGSLSPAFSSSTTYYTVNIANNITSITLTATKSHAAATVTGDGTKTGLAVGNNTFNMVVTAEDGTTTKTYTITVNRVATLYAESDKTALRAFLRQPSAEAGKLNLQQLGLTIADTANWQTGEAWVAKIVDLTWDDNTPKRLTEIGYSDDWNWDNKSLAGNFNLMACTNLQIISCESNQLTQLNIAGLKNLQYLWCSSNQLTQLNLTGCNNLQTLWCYSNQLTQLDLTGCDNLQELKCSDNQITALDVSKNMALNYLECSWNQFTILDVSKNTDLTNLDCSYNRLMVLDISKNIALTYLDCNNNQLATLDISKNTALTKLYYYNNAIPLADLKKASDRISNVNYKYLGTQNLPPVNAALNTAMPVDTVFNGINTLFIVSKLGGTAIMGTDYTLSNGRITFKVSGIYKVTVSNPAITSYSDYPAKVVATYIAGTVEKQQITFTWTGSTSSKSFTIHASQGKTFTINWGDGTDTIIIGEGTNDITPSHKYANTNNYIVSIAGNTADGLITYLYCGWFNQLTALDVSKSTTLTSLDCGGNQLAVLDVSKNTDLTYLWCYDNQLTVLNISKNTALTRLLCSDNQLTTLDVSRNTALTGLECDYNQISALDITKNTALTSLRCYNNQISALDVSKNTALIYIDCETNRIPLSDLYAASVKITSINNKYLGTQQPVFFTDTNIVLNGTLDFSSQKAFGNPACNTVFTVKKGAASAALGTDYTINNGIITFKTAGTYTVEMTNDSIKSHSSYPAKAITGNIIVANPTYIITASAGSNGSISPNGNVTVNKGANQSFTITPNTGYEINQVWVDGSAVALGNYTFTNVTANHTISVTFKQKQYSLTANAGTNGTISPNGVTTIAHGGSQTYTITPNIGYEINQVLVDGSAVVSGNYTFTNVTANHTISVSFKQKQYSLTATAGSNGSISPNGVTTIAHGGSQTYTITPNTGYEIDQVWVDGSAAASGNYTFSNVTANHTISVSFKQKQYTLTASAGSNGSISPSGVTTIAHGGSQTYTITPNTGYEINQVLVDGSAAASGNYTFSNVTANHTISVSFKQKQYSLTATAGSNGSISPSGVTTIVHGGSQIYTITPNTGYEIDMVKVDGVAVASGNYSFSNVTANHNISVTFKQKQYTLTATAGANGSISPGGGTTVVHGGSQTYTITPNTGYEIDQVWVDGLAAALGNYTFTNVTANHSISVSFKQKQYTLTATAGANGTISPSGVTTVAHGGSQTYTLTPNTGYEIDQVLVDGLAVASGNYTFTNVTANHTISVSFKQKQYSLTASAGANGSISPSGVTTVVHGGSQIYTITPNTGYEIDMVKVDGVAVASGNYSFSNVTANHNISVTFKQKQYTITANAGNNGTISPSGLTTAAHGNSQTYTITPNTGYEIDTVKVDGVAVASGNYTFTNVTANHSISVTFKQKQYTITANAGTNGSINPNGISTVLYGENQSYTITPNTAYEIDQVWVDGMDDSQNVTGGVYIFNNVQANHTIIVSFKIKQYTISASVNGSNGSITPSGENLVNHGGSISYIITPHNTYEIDKVLVDGIDNPEAVANRAYTFSNITENHTISVSFKQKQYTITATTGSNGTISPEGITTVTYGGSQTYTITPNTGYEIDTVKVDGTAVASGNYTFTNVTANHTISVSFKAVQYTITASASANGSITPSGTTSVAHGGSQTYTITPNTGHEIDQVWINGINNAEAVSAGTYTFSNVTANHSIVVSFKQTTSIDETPATANNLKVYPNPVINGQLIIVYEIPRQARNDGKLLNNSTIQQINIYDITGKQVGSYGITGEKTTIDVSWLPNGVYFIKVGNEVRKVVKQ